MPLISVNLRDPGGFASHRSYVTQQVTNSLKESVHSDLLIICRSGHVLKCHQSLLEPLSPLLSSLLQQHNCCNCSSSSCGRRETVQLHLPDIRRRTMELLLDVIYTGNGQCRRKYLFDEVKELMSLLDIKIPGDFRFEDPTGHFETPTASNASISKSKKHYSVSEVGSLQNDRSQEVYKHKNPQNGLLQMIQDLLPLKENKVLECNYLGCRSPVKAHNVTSHFQAHFNEFEKNSQVNEKKENVSPFIFKCRVCSKSFKFRMALEHHKRKHHKQDLFMLKPSQCNKNEIPNTQIKKEVIKEVIDHEVGETECMISGTEKKRERSRLYKHEQKLSDTDNNVDVGEEEESGTNIDLDENNSVTFADNTNQLTNSEEYKCSKCSKVFDKRSKMKIHIGVVHYIKKLKEIYSGTECGICELKVTTNKGLCKHVCRVHESVLTYLLAKDGLTLQPHKKITMNTPLSNNNRNEEKKEGFESKNNITEDKKDMVKPIDIKTSRNVRQKLECQICFNSYFNRWGLRVHYVSVHYYTDILKQFGKEKAPTNVCPVCEISLPKPSSTKVSQKKIQLNHLAGKHANLLTEYLMKDNIQFTMNSNQSNNVYTGEDKSYSLGEHGYNIKNLRIDIKKGEGFFMKVKENKALKNITMKRKKSYWSHQTDTDSSSPKRVRREVVIPKLTLQQLMKCFLCGIDLNDKTQIDLLLHYSQEHYRLELERNYVGRPDSVWSTNHCCPKCGKKIEQQNEFIKHIGVDHRCVEDYIPEKYRLPSNSVESPPSFPCPVSGCSSDKETKRSLLVHLLIVHYQKEMEREFGTKFKTLSGLKNCPICNMVLLDNYLGYMKHIAVEHEYVLKFVNKGHVSFEPETTDDRSPNNIEITEISAVHKGKIDSSPVVIDIMEEKEEFIKKDKEENYADKVEICEKKKEKDDESNSDLVTLSVKLTPKKCSQLNCDTIPPVILNEAPKESSGPTLALRAIWDSDSDGGDDLIIDEKGIEVIDLSDDDVPSTNIVNLKTDNGGGYMNTEDIKIKVDFAPMLVKFIEVNNIVDENKDLDENISTEETKSITEVFDISEDDVPPTEIVNFEAENVGDNEKKEEDIEIVNIEDIKNSEDPAPMLMKFMSINSPVNNDGNSSLNSKVPENGKDGSLTLRAILDSDSD